MTRILVVEDDERTVELLAELLEMSDFEVRTARDGDLGLTILRNEHIDLVILDVMLPGRDGLSVLSDIRTLGQTPVVMLTARGEPQDRVRGLDGGADDYVPKPFDPTELVSRVRAVLRRVGVGNEPPGPIETGRLTVDPTARTVHVDGQEVVVTTTEFDLLRTLAENAGRVVPREELMERARGVQWSTFHRSVDVHMSNIRKKIGDNPRSPEIIKTIRGVGYHLVVS